MKNLKKILMLKMLLDFNPHVEEPKTPIEHISLLMYSHDSCFPGPFPNEFHPLIWFMNLRGSEFDEKSETRF